MDQARSTATLALSVIVVAAAADQFRLRFQIGLLLPQTQLRTRGGEARTNEWQVLASQEYVVV